MAEPVVRKRRVIDRPRLRTLDQGAGERRASWLELFFDLVFVLAVSQVAHMLSDHSDLLGLAKYLALFLPIWYSWIGYTFYADRFETDETAFRILIFAGMLALTGMSVTLLNAFTPEGWPAFVVCFILVKLVLVTLYARAAYYVPLARPYCSQFIIGLSVSSLLLVVSLFVDAPVRYVIWAGSIAVELLIPFFNLRATRLIPIDRSHIPERFGLFTIIVLGEAVIATATGAGLVQWSPVTILTASFGFAMAACIWWINFDFVEDNAITAKGLFPRFVYMYGHFFIVATIVAAGIGVEHAIKESPEPHLHLPTLLLISGAIAVYLTAITVVRIVTGVCNVVLVRVATIIVALLLIPVGQFIPPVATIAVYLMLMISGIWIETRYSRGRAKRDKEPHLTPCDHADDIKTFEARSKDGCEECRKNNYKWVHLRLCLACGHVGCCDTSIHKHATKHFNETGHAIMASLETGENWAWCYEDERFVPLPRHVK